MSLETAGTRGVLVQYGARNTDEKRGGNVTTGSRTQQIVYKFDYSDLPGGASDALTAFVPAGAMVTEAYFNTTTTFAGGTSYDIGMEQSDGSTAIDADGLFDALVLADIDATVAGSLTATEHGGTNSGVLCGQRLAVDGYLVVAATGSFTAGECEFILEYVI